MTSLNLPQSMFLLLTGPGGAVAGHGTDRALAVAAAALVELVRADLLALTDDAKPRVAVGATAGDPGDPALATALDRLRRREGKKLQDALPAAKGDIDKAVGAGLADLGMVDVSRVMLGLGTRYPERDGAAEAQLRQRLADVAAGRTQATVDDAVLLGIAKGCGTLKHVVDASALGLRRRELDERVDAVVAAVSDAGAVSDAVRAATRAAAVAVGAITAATVAATIGGS